MKRIGVTKLVMMTVLYGGALSGQAGWGQTAGGQTVGGAEMPRVDPAQWWKHVEFLADDRLEGRNTGSEGHRLAGEYIVQQFQAIGLQPGANGAFLQQVPFEARTIDEGRSWLKLTSQDGKTREIPLGKEAMLGTRVAATGEVSGELVFVGYGIRMKEKNFDDLAGLSLRGKIAVYIAGAPKGWPSTLTAHAQTADVRWAELSKAGAIGMISIARVQTVPWARASAARLLPSMAAIEPQPTGGQAARKGVRPMQTQITWNPEHAQQLFAGTGKSLTDLFALAAKGEKLPTFPLQKKVSTVVASNVTKVDSFNVVGLLEGSDKKLRKEFVVVTAHLDHLGKTTSFAGDGIFNGAMDNASGVAAVVEASRVLAKARPKRSVVFVALCGEEKGLQGSRYFARNPTVPKKKIVANTNLDMFMPLHALKSITILGVDESTLGDLAKESAAAFGLPVLPDPIPEQNRFIRSDQYSFVREGIPALAFKFGFAPNTPEADIQNEWLKVRYHAVSDDVNQPVDKEGAARFADYLANLIQRTGNAPEAPKWKSDSFFRRFRK